MPHSYFKISSSIYCPKMSSKHRFFYLPSFGYNINLRGIYVGKQIIKIVV